MVGSLKGKLEYHEEYDENKWNETKYFINGLGADWRSLISKAKEKTPTSVTERQIIDRGTFWQIAFKHNGHECFVRVHEFKKTNKDTLIDYMAFCSKKYKGTNAKVNKCYLRNPNKETLEDGLDEGLI